MLCLEYFKKEGVHRKMGVFFFSLNVKSRNRKLALINVRNSLKVVSLVFAVKFIFRSIID